MSHAESARELRLAAQPVRRYYVLRHGRIHYVMDRERGKAGGPGEAVIFYRHAEEAERRAAQLEAEGTKEGAPVRPRARRRVHQ